MMNPALQTVIIFRMKSTSALSLAAITNVFSAANHCSGKAVFQWSETDDPQALNSAADTVVLCGDQYWPSARMLPEALISAIQRASKGRRFIALGSGAVVLASAGLLSGRRAAAHWQLLDSLRARFADIQFGSQLFECDGLLWTCAGELASLHLALHWVREVCGNQVAGLVADQLQCDKIRMGSDRQKLPLSTHLGAQDPKLLEGVALMEANIEEPLATSEIADYLCISRRQLERLFKKYLQQVPSRYYLNLRLEAAKKLLIESNLSIVDIGARCGFSSGPHFSTAYRQRFDLTPRLERSQFMNREQELQDV